MQFEKIRTINKRKIIVEGLISLGVISAISVLSSLAKYRTAESFNIANGTINYKVPDLKIMAIYQENDTGRYDEITDMPNNGYVINEDKTYCTTDNVNQTKGKIKTESGKVILQSLTKGDKCYLYFDKLPTVENTLAKLGIENPKEPTSNMFASIANTDEGVFKASDGMHGGTSYYYRGAVTNNYVKFAGFCWRIIRINGDGTIRMIYDGASCHANGTNTAESIAKANQVYNSSNNKSYYIGYTYGTAQRPENNAVATASNLKIQIDTWYKTNITDKGYDSKVAEGKFCNDRNTASGTTWAAAPSSTFSYAAGERLNTNKVPSLDCSSDDIYTLKAGAITADEVSFAGGVYAIANNSYYLYNGQSYWTMSPHLWISVNNEAYVFVVSVDGNLGWSMGKVNTTFGVRPVINLKVDTIFSSGDGSQSSPFIVQ